jgi:hypothetical protein
MGVLSIPVDGAAVRRQTLSAAESVVASDRWNREVRCWNSGSGVGAVRVLLLVLL